jgi:2',3'-cyclic-nucleotide 2'-phosphodiesterase (5'-nucleotidase family)
MGVACLIAAQDFSLKMPKVVPAFLKEGRAEEEFKKAAEIVSDFKRQGVDLVVFVTHLGLEADKKLAEEVEGIDIIIGGDSHSTVNKCEIVKNKKNKTCIVQASAEGQYLSHLEVTLWEGKPSRFRAKLIELDEQVTIDPEINQYILLKKSELERQYDQIIATNDCFLEGTKFSK